MEDNILKQAYLLSENLKSDPRVIKLNKLEAQLEASDEAKVLSYQMDVAATRYSDALKIYARDSEEIKPFLANLSKAKERLNSLEIVKQYNQAYKEVKLMYEDINNIVFNPFRNSLDLREKK